MTHHASSSIELSDVTFVLRKFFLPILITCGFILNMISFNVMQRIKGSSTAKYMSFLGLVDSGVLLLGGVNLWLHSANYSSLPMASVIGCKLVPFLFYSLADYSVFIIVIMTAERFYAVWKPVHTSHLNKKRLFRLNLVLASLFCMLVNSHFILTHSLDEQIDEAYQEEINEFQLNSTLISLIEPKVNKICVYVKWKVFYEKYWIYIDASIYSFIPFILITIFNILIIKLLSKADKKSNQLDAEGVVCKLRKRTTSCDSKEENIVFRIRKKRSDHSNSFSLNNQLLLSSIDSRCKCEAINTRYLFKSELTSDLKRNSSQFTKSVSLEQIRVKRTRIKTRLIVMLITINISFCVLSMPMVIMQIFYYSFINKKSNEISISSLVYLIQDNKEANYDQSKEIFLQSQERLNNETNNLVDLLHCIAELLQYLNHGSNFILYCLSGSTFRNETKSFFRLILNVIKKLLKCK